MNGLGGGGGSSFARTTLGSPPDCASSVSAVTSDTSMASFTMRSSAGCANPRAASSWMKPIGENA